MSRWTRIIPALELEGTELGTDELAILPVKIRLVKEFDFE